MMRILSLCLAMFGAPPALALSCLPPTVEQAFMVVQESPDIYVPVIGHFEGFAPRIPDNSGMPQDRQFWANFSGDHISSRGRDQAIRVQVLVSETCAASWCGNLPSGATMLTFLRKTGNGYSFTYGACGGNAFVSPSATQVQTVRNCMAWGSC